VYLRRIESIRGYEGRFREMIVEVVDGKDTCASSSVNLADDDVGTLTAKQLVCDHRASGLCQAGLLKI
jgi:hypothetical protein